MRGQASLKNKKLRLDGDVGCNYCSLVKFNSSQACAYGRQ